ncbi:uncharacterized protein YmfQ (DUF2313 family) [Paucimonas lemoignei]|uniref:Uncharacterized protein YmfQ (DUF2313 family) n=1 Tax=Paucimonas lemoignei TaxID=29443 RepID=A0A4R3I196_PAULE|nr:putative phage tail protein [Paucimonas lemoignei]TCS38471.1 uncharacterized protein YmfQ (DUF2313 family) [Paucimonas lemoignei]
MSRHADLLKLLLPSEAYDKSGAALTADVEGVGNQLDGFQLLVEAILLEIDPRTTSMLLPDWERVYGLPDECRGAVETLADRRNRLAAKVAETGGISKSYFIRLAAALGYPNVTITKFKPTNCEMSCEGAFRDESWRFAWQMNVPGQTDIHTQFSAESSCEEPVDFYKQGPLECLITKLQPAEGIVLFNYVGA